MYPSRLLPQFHLRLSSQELKHWLSNQAKINHRTLSAEINFHLERAMAQSEHYNAKSSIQQSNTSTNQQK